MIFQVKSTVVETQALGRYEFWEWVLCEGTVAKPGNVLCVSPREAGSVVGTYISEEATRSAIAAFRKKAGGMRFAKVVIK